MRKSKRDWVRELAAQGLRTKEIALVTGLSFKTIEKYSSGYNIKSGDLQENSIEKKFPAEKQAEWNRAVNRIRKACGKPPLQEVDEEEAYGYTE